MDFKSKLIEVRKAKGLTQEELAEKSNVTARTMPKRHSVQDHVPGKNNYSKRLLNATTKVNWIIQ